MDRDAFLNLLVTQLRYQDPSSPMDDTQFVSQLAQFSSLEQMQNLNTGFTAFGQSATANQAFSMTGKWIDYVDASGNTVTGRVDSVSLENGAPKLIIGTNKVDLSSVQQVYPDMGSFSKGKLSIEAFGMIGGDVDYYDPATGSTCTGKVDSVSFDNGWPMLNIGSNVVDARNVIKMHDGSTTTATSDLTDQANAMAGHKISYTDSTGQVQQGKVDSVSIVNGVPKLKVGQLLLDVSQVVKVY